MKPETQSTAIVLFAHGSRDPLWHRPMQSVADQVQRNHPSMKVRCAYLELSSPDLPTACAELVAQGCEHVRIVPMFLGVGRHAREDLPLLVQAMREQYPTIHFDLQPSVGEDERLVRTLAEIAAGVINT